MSKRCFITTTIPYVNSRPHIGHAQEFALADALVRSYRQKDFQVILQSGTDDNAYKNVISAKELGLETKTFVDENAQAFRELLEQLNVEVDYFVRTSSLNHAQGVTAFIKKLDQNDIYLGSYAGLYCQGCEDFFDTKDLTNGLCPDHQRAPDEIIERNFFFKLSRYQKTIFELIQSDRVLIKPTSRKKEILNFIEAGLKDISISRSRLRSPGWGIPFPDSSDHVVYVWIDALINYLSGAGFGRNEDWRQVWSDEVYKIHVIGKNVWKFHAIYWLGLLLSAKLPLPNEIFIHGFLTNKGIKISKSLNNGGHLASLIKRYGADAIRFYLLHRLSFFEDSDFSEDQLHEAYNTVLANKFGNLASRILTLRGQQSKPVTSLPLHNKPDQEFLQGVRTAFELVNRLNSEIESTKPWELLRRQDIPALELHLDRWVAELLQIGSLVAPVLPGAAQTLQRYISCPPQKMEPLFPRLRKEP